MTNDARTARAEDRQRMEAQLQQLKDKADEERNTIYLYSNDDIPYYQSIGYITITYDGNRRNMTFNKNVVICGNITL